MRHEPLWLNFCQELMYSFICPSNTLHGRLDSLPWSLSQHALAPCSPLISSCFPTFPSAVATLPSWWCWDVSGSSHPWGLCLAHSLISFRFCSNVIFLKVLLKCHSSHFDPKHFLCLPCLFVSSWNLMFLKLHSVFVLWLLSTLECRLRKAAMVLPCHYTRDGACHAAEAQERSVE